jgi:hypothetical protein
LENHQLVGIPTKFINQEKEIIMISNSSIKRMQQFAHKESGNKIRVTKVTKTELTSRKHDLVTIVSLGELGVADKKSQRVVKSDSIRRHYVKVAK